ncbi:MAG: cell envelope integrity protein TolA [Mesorhizobium sp.]|uniref:cell envelope integrity protein TolA n=1 Tax=Mesorhizobium sp. TaxID=1871066 RepID=UPI001AC040BE|nr:cell envelope integrity protein TolA [Mesorhizobium sp.]MBN9217584.1 cell envelope integrity protein TolA [Mesorhizobium sp.]
MSARLDPAVTIGLGESNSDSSRHGPVLAATLAALLLSGGGSNAAEITVQRDIADYLMKAIQVCWNVPASAKHVAHVEISLNKDGSLAGPPKIVGPVTPSRDAVAEAAIRAITRCAPFPGLASYTAHYDLWRDVVLTFNPAEDTAGAPAKMDATDLDKLLEKYRKAK